MKGKTIRRAAVKYAFMNWESEDYHKAASEGVPFDPIEYTKNNFIAGVEWAEKRFILKAVKWLKDNVSDYILHPLPDLDVEELIYDFRGAMEE